MIPESSYNPVVPCVYAAPRATTPTAPKHRRETAPRGEEVDACHVSGERRRMCCVGSRRRRCWCHHFAILSGTGTRVVTSTSPRVVAAGNAARRAGRIVARRFTEGLPAVAEDIAAGRAPESLPAAGRRGGRGAALVNTARAMARRNDLTAADYLAVYYLYTAAIWADEHDTTVDAAARVELCTTPPPPSPRPCRPPRVLARDCGRHRRGLAAAVAAAHGPPSRPYTDHTPHGWPSM